jgi:hypothetical protein
MCYAELQTHASPSTPSSMKTFIQLIPTYFNLLQIYLIFKPKFMLKLKRPAPIFKKSKEYHIVKIQIH